MHSSRPSLFLFLGIAVIATVLALACTRLTWVENLDWDIHDHFQRVQAPSFQGPTDVTLITIDEVSLATCTHLAGTWPWRRDSYAALLLTLDQMGAKAVGIDILFNESSTESYYDDLLLSVIEALDMPVVLARLEDRGLAEPLATWRLQGKVDLANDSDGVARRVVPEGSFSSVLYANAGGMEDRAPLEILRFHGSFDQAWLQRSFQASPLVIAGFDMITEASAQTDILDPDKLRGWLAQRKARLAGADQPLRGKIVIVGTTAAGTFDVKTTPVGRAEPGMLIHATALRNLMDGQGIIPVPLTLIFILGLLCAILIALCAAHIQRAVVFALSAFALCLGIYFLSGVLISQGWWLPPVGIISAILLTAAGGIIVNFRAETLRKKEITGLFGRFVSPTVVESLIENPSLASPGGREEICTVFFSDLAGFTSISELLSPSALVGVINEYLEAMSRTILDHEGTIDKYIGDAVMAFWNAPLPQPDHAIRACSAALECRRATREIATRFREKYNIDLFTRFGLHSGPVVVGPIGSSSRLDYTVLGDTVNLSSRLEGANKNYGTTFLVTQTTKELTGGQFAWRPVDLLRVKGKREPIAVFELLGFSGEITGPQQVALDFFLKGFDQYQAAQFADALENFKLAFERESGENLYALYVDRARAFSVQPPGSDWDGVYTMTTK